MGGMTPKKGKKAIRQWAANTPTEELQQRRQQLHNYVLANHRVISQTTLFALCDERDIIDVELARRKKN